MRALSSFDRAFLLATAVILILLAPVLWGWHRHWCAVLTTVAAIRPHPQIAVTVPTTDAALLADWQAWKERFPQGPDARPDRQMLVDLRALLARGLRVGHRAALHPGENPFAVGFESKTDADCLREAAFALKEQDGTPAERLVGLDGIDAIIAALSPPDSYPLLRTRCIATLTRDELALSMRVSGQLPPERARRWRAHEDDVFGNLLAAAESMHRYWEPAYWSWRVGTDPFSFAWHRGYMYDSRKTWWSAANDAASALSAEATDLDAAIAAGHVPTTPAGVGATSFADQAGQAQTFLRMHRLACLAMDVLDRADRDGALPASINEPGSGLALDEPGFPPATYARRDAQSFVITTGKEALAQSSAKDQAVFLYEDFVFISRLGATTALTTP